MHSLTNARCRVSATLGAQNKQVQAVSDARHAVQGFVKKFNAETMQAVPNMLELVPHGVNKGSGMRKLLANLELPVEVCSWHLSDLTWRHLNLCTVMHCAYAVHGCLDNMKCRKHQSGVVQLICKRTSNAASTRQRAPMLAVPHSCVLAASFLKGHAWLGTLEFTLNNCTLRCCCQ